MAFQRARASNGRSSWVGELYGMEPRVITRNISRITYELMIEQQRQERMAENERTGKSENMDIDLVKDRKSTRLNSSHIPLSRMPSSA